MRARGGWVMAVLAVAALCFGTAGCGRRDAPLRGSTFDAAAWKAADPYSGVRARMLGDYLDRVGIVDRDRKAIEADLGPPRDGPWNDRLPFPAYVVGTYDPTGFDGGTAIGLLIEYDQDSRAVGYFTPFRSDGTFKKRR